MPRRMLIVILAALIAWPTQLVGEIRVSAAQPADHGGALVPYHPPTGQYVDPKPFTASIPSTPVPRMVTSGPDPKAPKGYIDGKSKEMPLARTANRNVYANPDGTYTAKIYSAPVNWLAGPNNWQPIDNGLVAAADGSFHNASGSMSMHFAKHSGQGPLVQVSSGGANLGFGAPTGLRAVMEAGGGIGLYNGKTQVLEIPAGQMSDSKQDPGRGDSATAPIDYSLVQTPGGTSLVVKADPAWLSSPARKYPVYIDPTVSNIYGNGDSYTRNDYPTYNSDRI